MTSKSRFEKAISSARRRYEKGGPTGGPPSSSSNCPAPGGQARLRHNPLRRNPFLQLKRLSPMRHGPSRPTRALDPLVWKPPCESALL